MTDNELTYVIISAAIEVHRHLGPGLLESTYRNCLVQELTIRGLNVASEKPIPVVYKNVKLECGFRLDLLVEDAIVVELKSVEAVAVVHEATVLTYLRLSHHRIGLLINFNVVVLKDGVRRYIIKGDANTEVTEGSTQRSQRMPEKKIRVLIAKPGLDGHDRGAKVIARALRDAGMEVIYTGLRQTPEMIASAAVQEDVDVIGLSILSGAHNTLCPQLMKLLHEKGMDDVTVLVGGIIPEADIPALKQSGISGIFLPGTSTQDIIDFIQKRQAQPR
jgi:methylmalonyl-CoA mutase, C-terminal domain